MQFKCAERFFVLLLLLTAFAQYSTAQTLTHDQTGTQTSKSTTYYYEYWNKNSTGTGSMTLGDSCNFSCTWSNIDNILFRKGIRPGSFLQKVTYSADYKPTGNSYLSVYGWMKNPLVEYYIIESWGTYKPPGVASKGSIETDSGTYDLYQNERTGASIEGPNSTFQQYWSVRRIKRTKGTINCGNHFNAWEAKGMKLGTLYEVSFNVEAYQSSGGTADVKATMAIGTGINNNAGYGSAKTPATQVHGIIGQRQIRMTAGGTQTISFKLPVKTYASLKVYNYLGQEVAAIGKREYSAGQNSVLFNASTLTSGVYYYTLKAGE